MKNNLDKYSWIASPDCSSQGEQEKYLIANRDKIRVINEVSYGEQYEFDDWALIKLGKDYFVLNTSGCSCPSPSTEWAVMAGPCTLAFLRKVKEDRYVDLLPPKEVKAVKEKKLTLKEENVALKKSLKGMLESYDLVQTYLSINPVLRDAVAGFYVGEIEKARKLASK